MLIWQPKKESSLSYKPITKINYFQSEQTAQNMSKQFLSTDNNCFIQKQFNNAKDSTFNYELQSNNMINQQQYSSVDINTTLPTTTSNVCILQSALYNNTDNLIDEEVHDLQQQIISSQYLYELPAQSLPSCELTSFQDLQIIENISKESLGCLLKDLSKGTNWQIQFKAIENLRIVQKSNPQDINGFYSFFGEVINNVFEQNKATMLIKVCIALFTDTFELYSTHPVSQQHISAILRILFLKINQAIPKVAENWIKESLQRFVHFQTNIASSLTAVMSFPFKLGKKIPLISIAQAILEKQPQNIYSISDQVLLDLLSFLAQQHKTSMQVSTQISSKLIQCLGENRLSTIYQQLPSLEQQNCLRIIFSHLIPSQHQNQQQ